VLGGSYDMRGSKAKEADEQLKSMKDFGKSMLSLYSFDRFELDSASI
jgi:hypothetical protein